MVMNFTQEDLLTIQENASLDAAAKCGISSVEAKKLSHAERMALIAQKSPNLGKKLEEFYSSYTAWLAFQTKIHDSGKQGALNAEESGKLVNLNHNILLARESLLNEMK